MPDEPHGNSVANVGEVADQFQGVGIPSVAELLDEAHDGLPTHLRPRLRPTVRVPHDGVRVEQLTPGIHVPSVPRLEVGPHDLHVLLRHRPRSIAQASVGVGVSVLLRQPH